jgi:hypothetical protein
MKKLSLCVLLAACLAGHSLFAIDFYNYGAGLGAGNLLINAGFGLGAPLFGETVVPPLSASVDYFYALNGFPLSFGGLIGLTTSELDFSYGSFGYTYSYSMFTLGARLGWHFDFGIDKLDTYGTLTLGYIFASVKADYTGDWGYTSQSDPVATGSFLFGLNVGARYFFTDMIGAYAEVGYSAFSCVSLGLTLKLGQAGATSARRAGSSPSSAPRALDSKLVGTWRITGTSSVTVFEFKADGTGSLTQGTKSFPLIHGEKSNTFTLKRSNGDLEQTYRIEDDGNKLVMPKFLGASYDGVIYNTDPPKPLSLIGTKWTAETALGKVNIEFKDKATCLWYVDALEDFPVNNTYTLKGNRVIYTAESATSVFFIEGNNFIMDGTVYRKQDSATAAPAALDSKLVGTWRESLGTITIFEFNADGTGSITLVGTEGIILLTHGKKSNTFTISGRNGMDQTYSIVDDGNELVISNYFNGGNDAHLYNIAPPKSILLIGTKWAAETNLGDMSFEFKDKSTCLLYIEEEVEGLNDKSNPVAASYTLKGNQVTCIHGEYEFVFFIEGNLFTIDDAIFQKQP